MRYLTQILHTSTAVFWALLLLLLPITSMPAVRDILRSSTVAGPSVLALAGVTLFGLIPYLIRGGGIPKTALPLIGFFFACILSISISFFIPIPSFKSVGLLRPAIQAIFTLLVGIGFLLVTYSCVKSEKDLRIALRWIYIGGLVMMLWSILQSTVWFSSARYPDWMRDVQDIFSLGPLYRQRTTGFALEPSWLAHMLNLLYLPVWLATLISGYSAFQWRLFKRITVETVLLAFGVLVLLLTFSRVGWLTFAIMVAYLVILGNISLVRSVRNRLEDGELRKSLITLGMTIVLLTIYLMVLLLAAYAMSRIDPRMQDLFTPQFWQLNNLNRYANALQFGERVVYWQAGWEVFNRYPIFGVGLGNAGKFFAETIPAYGVNLIEVRRLLFKASELPNPKNLWIRILAETGIIGFAFYSAWISSILKRGLFLRSKAQPIYKMLGYLGIFIIIGIMLEGFSIDSFAMPYFWVSTGLVLSGTKFLTRSG